MRRWRGSGLVALGAIAGIAGAGAFLKHALLSMGDESSDEVALVAVLDGVEVKSRATAFRGGSVLAWMGGAVLDLREASLAPSAVLSVHSLLGGVVIRVPPGRRVESHLHALLGGIDVSRLDTAPSESPTLTLHGLALLGRIAAKP